MPQILREAKIADRVGVGNNPFRAGDHHEAENGFGQHRYEEDDDGKSAKKK
jgi:hypothetical protein